MSLRHSSTQTGCKLCKATCTGIQKSRCATQPRCICEYAHTVSCYQMSRGSWAGLPWIINKTSDCVNLQRLKHKTAALCVLHPSVLLLIALVSSSARLWCQPTWWQQWYCCSTINQVVVELIWFISSSLLSKSCCIFWLVFYFLFFACQFVFFCFISIQFVSFLFLSFPSCSVLFFFSLSFHSFLPFACPIPPFPIFSLVFLVSCLCVNTTPLVPLDARPPLLRRPWICCKAAQGSDQLLLRCLLCYLACRHWLLDYCLFFDCDLHTNREI